MQINWPNTFQRSRSARNPSLRETEKKLWLVVVPPERWLKKASVPRVADQDELDPRPLSTRARVKIATREFFLFRPRVCPSKPALVFFAVFFLIQNAEMMLACFPLKFK